VKREKCHIFTPVFDFTPKIWQYAKKQIVKRLTIGSLPLETRRGGLL
jgi:hypothetical protein